MSGVDGSNGDGGGGGSWAYLPPGAFSGADLPPGAADVLEHEPSMPAPPQRAQEPQRRVVPERPALPASQAAPPPHQGQSQGALPLQPGAPTGRRRPVPSQMVAYPPRAMQPPRALGVVEPATVNRHMLGASTVLLGVGSLMGGHFGGLYGSIAGALFAGSAINALRASSAAMQPDPEQQKQARISAAYALVGGAVGGYVWWKKAEPRRATPNRPRSRKTATRNESRNCGFRPIGP